MVVRLTHLDGTLPNLALMKLGRWHRERGDDVRFTRNARRDLFEPAYDVVYGSAIFARSAPLIERLRTEFPGAIVGGTGSGSQQTVETVLGQYGEVPERVDYADYPGFEASIGFTQRGCRLACGFCVVPEKEGRPKPVATIADIYRGAPYPRHVHLLDNDFFGQPKEAWRARLAEIHDGGFRVCFNQGINVRLIDDEIAAALASTPYYDDAFRKRRLYTAWDNVGHEAIFVRGVERLFAAGVLPHHLLVYMLVGYDPAETWERIFHRFDRMVGLGVKPFPMVFDRRRRDLLQFQRWVIRRYYEFIPWAEFRTISETGRARLHRQAVEREAQVALTYTNDP